MEAFILALALVFFVGRGLAAFTARTEKHCVGDIERFLFTRVVGSWRAHVDFLMAGFRLVNG